MKILKKKYIAIVLVFFLSINLFLTLKFKYFEGESPNFKDGKFWNSFDHSGFTRESRKGNSFFKWQMERRSKNLGWKKEDIEKYSVYRDFSKIPESENLSVVFVGHATFLIQMHGVNFLTDPIWSERPSPVSFIGPKRHTKPGVNFEDLPKIDYVLISHSHYDHMDIPTIKMLKKAFDPVFIVGLGNCTFLNKKVNLNLKCEERDWGQGVEIKEGFNVFFEKAKHWSKRSFFNSNQTLWGSFILKSAKYNVFFSGDTAFATHFKMLKEQYGSFDLSIIGIGAYKPDYIMQYSHLSPAEGAKAHLELNSKQSFGMHLKTFQLSDETFNEPVEDLEKAKLELKIAPERFRVLDFGERVNFK